LNNGLAMSVTWRLGQDLQRLIDLLCREIHETLAPHGAKFDPAQPELLRHDMARVVEVGRDLVVDDSDLEGRFRCLSQDSAGSAKGSEGCGCGSQKKCAPGRM
jgi:hypothetical protein